MAPRGPRRRAMRFDGYATDGFCDELFLPDGSPRPGAKALVATLEQLSDGELRRRQSNAELALRNQGITFNVYGDAAGVDKVFPFDIVPRIVEAREWEVLARGLRQRIRALNAFLHDVYHEQRIVDAGIVPEHVIASSKGFRPQCIGLEPPLGVWCHVTGTDLVRDRDGRF